MSSRRISRPQTDTSKKVLRSSPKLAESITTYRKASLEEEINSGNLVEGGNLKGSFLVRGAAEPPPGEGDLNRGEWVPVSPGENKSSGRRKVGINSVGAIAHSSSFTKKANSINTTSGSGSTAGGSVERLAPEVYSPLFTMANLNLPRDRITVNAWIRNFFQLHPIVRNAITLHATYPISKINIKCHDKKVLRFFEDMVEEMGLMESLGDIALEYWKLGECVRSRFSYIFTDSGPKAIEEISIGDRVLTHTGKYQIVKDKLINWKHKEYISILPQGFCEPIEVSPNHPFFVAKVGNKHRHQKKSKIINSNPSFINEDKWKWDWVKAENLEINDLCLIPVNRIVEDNNEFSKEWCRLLGIYLSEGCFSYNGKYNKDGKVKCTIISNKDEELWKFYDGIFKNCGLRLVLNGMNGYLRSIKDKNETQKIAQKIKLHAGELSKFKKISKEMMFLSPEKQMEIVNGFVDGDGWIHRGRICMATISKVLAYQFRDILARNFITCSINKHTNNRKNPIYFIEIPLFYAKKFNLYTTKQKKLDIELNNRTLNPNNIPRQKFSKEGHIITPIKKIYRECLPENEPLYNLEVENDNSYCVNGIAVHNCFPYAELDEKSGKWAKIVIQNPDYVHVKKTVLSGEPIISLKPDAVLQRLVMSSSPADVQLRKQIPEKIIHHVRAGQDIPLDNFNISHLKMLSSPYDVRGTSIIVSAFKDLMLYDKLREAKFAQADGMINPITIIKVGGSTDGEYRATNEDIEFFRQIFEEAQYDKDFKLITHAGVSVERIGFSGQVLEIGPDMELIIKNIYTGLMIPPAVVDTESAVYSSASIGLEVLRQRYFNFRNMMASWLTNKIFAPISEIQKFYEYEDGVKRLIVPEIEWNQMNLYDLQDYIQNITGLVSQKQASLQTLYRSLGLSYQDEIVKMRQEMIRDAIRMKEEEALRKMTVTELRTLDPEKEVMDPVDSKEREMGGGAMPGMPEAGGGLPGMGAPGGMPGGIGMPEMGGMGGGAPTGGPELAPPPIGPGGGPPGGTPPGAAPPPALGPGI